LAGKVNVHDYIELDETRHKEHERGKNSGVNERDE
jgi:hypothetical protein